MSDEYDFWDDFNKSVLVAYEAVRERVRNGGPPWMPPKIIDCENDIIKLEE